MAIRKRRAELAELEAAMKEAKRRDRRSVFVIGSKPSDDTEGDPHWGRRKSDLNHATPVRWDQVTLEQLAAVPNPGLLCACRCGVLFVRHHAARYCSAACQANARRPSRLEINCAACNKPIPQHGTSRRTRRFCGDACRQRAYRKRITAI
jgi:hypothetical protein